MDEVYEFFKKAGTYYLATMDGDQPRVRPFGTVDIFEGRLYVQTGQRKDVSHQIAVNPKVEMTAFVDGDWVRLAGTLVDDHNEAAATHMLEAYPALKERYAVGDGNHQVLHFTDATATFYSFKGDPTAEPKVVRF